MLNSNLIIFKIGDTLMIKLPFDLQTITDSDWTRVYARLCSGPRVLDQESKSRTESWWRKKLEMSAIIKLRKLEPTTF